MGRYVWQEIELITAVKIFIQRWCSKFDKSSQKKNLWALILWVQSKLHAQLDTVAFIQQRCQKYCSCFKQFYIMSNKLLAESWKDFLSFFLSCLFFQHLFEYPKRCLNLKANFKTLTIFILEQVLFSFWVSSTNFGVAPHLFKVKWKSQICFNLQLYRHSFLSIAVYTHFNYSIRKKIKMLTQKKSFTSTTNVANNLCFQRLANNGYSETIPKRELKIPGEKVF